MHEAAYNFVKKALYKLDAEGARVLEIGSYIVNGSVRGLFSSADTYVGLDKRAGPGVDAVVEAEYYDGRGRFDFVVSTETLEHDPRPQDILWCAWRALRPGGTLLVTTAGSGRPPHNDDGYPLGDGDYFTTFTPEEMKRLLKNWVAVKVIRNTKHADIYVQARKPKNERVSRQD